MLGLLLLNLGHHVSSNLHKINELLIDSIELAPELLKIMG